MLLSPSALLDSTGVVEVIYGEGIQLWLASSATLDSSDKLINYTPLSRSWRAVAGR